MAVNHIETANVLLPGEVKNWQKSDDGWRPSKKARQIFKLCELRLVLDTVPH